MFDQNINVVPFPYLGTTLSTGQRKRTWERGVGWPGTEYIQVGSIKNLLRVIPRHNLSLVHACVRVAGVSAPQCVHALSDVLVPALSDQTGIFFADRLRIPVAGNSVAELV
jgi:hypothetical protein